MWSAFSRLFVKNTNPAQTSTTDEYNEHIQESMEKQQAQNMDSMDSKQTRQRASVKWILSKAFNNQVPENLKEPFYRDMEGQEHLKPQIVVGLGNATLYCQTLTNLYSDPNYQSLNHWSILQTLARKGVPVTETPDTHLTETVLIQTNPLRINAHMSVIEALMILYAKEVATSERISSAIGRISGGSLPKENHHYESALLCWISHACAALKKRIDQEIESVVTDDSGARIHSPDMPPLRDFRDLCDGVSLAFLIAYYCPKVVPWTSVRVNYLPTVEDSIFNVLLVSNFCQKYLPYSVFHMTPQDITYMRGSMKQNLVVLLADFFNLFEIHPTKCVCYPGMEQPSDIDIGNDNVSLCSETDNEGVNEHGIAHRRGLTCQPVTPIPDLRSGLESPTSSPLNKQPFQVVRSASATMRKISPPKEHADHSAQDEGFVVHRGRTIPTLASMQEPLVPARLRQAKEKSNNDSKADERGDNMAAGRPSNWEDARRPSYAGRRSRRNSFSEDSQLTIENFGGSQDQLNMIGRTSERERKFSNSTINNVIEPAVAVRSSIADARGTLQIGYDTEFESEKQDRETEKHRPQRPASSGSSSSNIDNNVSLSKIIHSKDHLDGDITPAYRNMNVSPAMLEDDAPKRKTSFAALPTVTTTWQQQSANLQQMETDNNVDIDRSSVDASKLTTIRMKLEEKRRHIEQEKRKMEVAMGKQQQKVGKAAFLQAINKGKTQTGKDRKDVLDSDVDKPERPCSLQDLADLNSPDSKWDNQMDTKSTPESDHLDLEQYQQSIAIMNNNLKDIQQDIHRLTNQQSQMQAQHIQAQQLLQAQQIANMISQYGSQQHIPGQFAGVSGGGGGGRNISNAQQNFGSSPQLMHQFSSPSSNNYPPMRQSSRDPHHTPPLQSQHQYINEHGQYIVATPPLQQQLNNMTSRECSPFMSDNNGQYGHYGGVGSNNYGPQSQYIESNQYQTYRAEQQHPPQSTQYYDDYRGNDMNSPQPNQFYLHDTQAQPQPPPARRTWAQSSNNSQSPIPLDINAWSQNAPQKVDSRTWKSPHQQSSSSSGGGGFMLHHQNGNNDYDKSEQSYQTLFPVHRQISQIMSGGNSVGGGGASSSSSESQIGDSHHDSRLDSRIPMTPPIDDMMAPQSISFIGDDDTSDAMQMNNGRQHKMQQQYHRPNADETDIDLGKLKITSGKLTYRIPSPTRPSLNMNSFQDPNDDANNENKGFYIAFDNDQPKRPKPPLRTKRSPKKDQNSESSSSKQEQINQLEHELDMERQYQDYNKRTSNLSSTNYERHSPLNNNRNNDEDSHSKRHFKQQQHQQQQQQNTMESQPITRRHVSDNQVAAILDRRHLEDVTNHHSSASQFNSSSSSNNDNRPKETKALIIDDQLKNLDPDSVDEMERKKEKIMLLSLQRRQQQEEAKARKEIDAMQRREKEREKEEERIRKREEQAARRQAILEQHKYKKAVEEAEQKGTTIDRNEFSLMKQQQHHHHQTPSAAAKMRPQKVIRPRPKTIHVETGSVDLSEISSLSSRNKKGSNSNLAGIGSLSSNSMRRDYYRGSQDSLAIRESPDEYPSSSSTPIGRRGSYKTSREPTVERGRTMSRISVAKGSNLNFRGRKSNSLMNLCDTDSGLGRATPPRRAPSPGMGPSGRHLPSPSGPGSLPPGFMNKRRIFDDGSSDISSAASSMMEYSGPKLYKQPATKSNRGIILNAVEYCVFPGVVNRDAKQKVLEKIARSEAKHFLVLFRDAGCQFRALYGYWPENETVLKLYGTGPSQVDEFMFDKFFKYNSGGKCFSQVHTKHLTVTIDAFTIHNSLWQGKKVTMPSKKDMALVI